MFNNNLGNLDIEFAQPNYYIFPGLVEEIYQTMKYLRMEDMVKIMEKMGNLNTQVLTEGSTYATVEDLACMLGESQYADSVGPVHFYAGPEMLKDSQFKVVTGTVLTWVMDCILYRITFEGYDILELIELKV